MRFRCDTPNSGPSDFLHHIPSRSYIPRPPHPSLRYLHRTPPDCRPPPLLAHRLRRSPNTCSVLYTLIPSTRASSNPPYPRIHPPPTRSSASEAPHPPHATRAPIIHSFVASVNVLRPPLLPEQLLNVVTTPHFAHTGYLHERSDFLAPTRRGLHQQVSPRLP